MNTTNTIKTLDFKTRAQAIEEAKALINLERSGHITGLYTRHEGINRAKMKYWRFRSVTCIAGMSGSGKSAILNMIEDDFTDPILNPTFMVWNEARQTFMCENNVLIIAFKYEMDAADEMLRTLSGKVSKSYSYLLSSDSFTPKQGESDIDEKGRKKYNTVTEEEFNKYSSELDKLANRPILYIENAGSIDQLYATVAYIRGQYPGMRLVITIDHTLLSVKISEKDDLELMSRTAKMGIRLKKEFNAAVIFLAQLNGEIEKPERRKDERLHFPVKTDIHAQSQIYWACDDVLVFHRPELLSIEKYGNVKMMIDGKLERHSVNATGIIHGHWIKSRKNRPGSIWFVNEFSQGKIRQIEPDTIRYKSII